MKGEVRVKVHSTESGERVKQAVRNVLGEIKLHKSDDGRGSILKGDLEKMEDLLPIRQLIARMRIRDAAFSFLTQSSTDDRLSFGLNKQAAYAGRASFHSADVSVLGPIQFQITGEIENIVGFLCGKF